MASFHVSTEEAVRDITAILKRVRLGEEAIIQTPGDTPILMRNADAEDLPDDSYDPWFKARVQQALESPYPHHSLDEMYAAGERLYRKAQELQERSGHCG